MNRIIINADDAGLHPEIDRGIKQCIDAQVVNSISVITNSPTVNFDLIRQWNKTVPNGCSSFMAGCAVDNQTLFLF